MLNQQTAPAPFRSGLEGIIAAETTLSHVDGQHGELILSGYPVEEIAPNATFEEMVYLMWHGRLPTHHDLTAFRSALASRRHLSPLTHTVVQQAAEQRLPMMDILRMAVGTLSPLPGETLMAQARETAVLLTAQLPTIIATAWRIQQQQPIVPPNPELNHAANFLAMLTGHTPTAAQTRALETYLNTVIDHGLNASTFAARVIIATESDLVSAVTGAIGALKGPLHGGAPGPALDMVLAIGTADRAESYLREKLAQGERLMGFGHRVYKVRDPRAEVLGAAAAALYQTGDQQELYALAKHVEQTAVLLLADYKPGRHLQTNVEFYTALLLHGIGVEFSLFASMFARSRVAGWAAHCLEQIENGRLIRPASSYIGPEGRQWQPIAYR